DDTIRSIAAEPELRVLKWLYTCEPKIFMWCEKRKFKYASLKGRKDVVYWLAKWFPDTVRSLKFAARGGELGLIKWLISNTKWDTDLEWLVKFLHANRSEGCTTRAMDSGAGNGHLEVVQWLHETRSEGCTVDAMDSAAARKWSKETMDAAASHGHLEVVKFLHNHRRGGCTRSAMTKAAQTNHLDVIKWLRANRRKASTEAAMNAAAACGCLRVVKWLYENGQGGCAVSAMTNAASCGYLNVVKFLAANYSLDWSEEAIAKAVLHGQTETVNLLEFMNKETEYCHNPSIFYSGRGNKFPEVVEWYKDHYDNPNKRKH
ncbi:hypothetical protein PHYSODRAFT_529565, partial [Phytophthora sojae]